MKWPVDFRRLPADRKKHLISLAEALRALAQSEINALPVYRVLSRTEFVAYGNVWYAEQLQMKIPATRIAKRENVRVEVVREAVRSATYRARQIERIKAKSKKP